MRTPNDLCRITLLTLGILLLSMLGRAQLPVTYSWLNNSFGANTTTEHWMAPGSQGICAAASDGTLYVNGHYDEGCGPVQQYTSAGAAVMQVSTDDGGTCAQAIACNTNYVYVACTDCVNPPSGTMWVGISRRNRPNVATATTFTGAVGGNQFDGYVPDFLVVDSLPSSQTNSHNLMGLAANNTYLYASDPTNTGNILEYNAASATNMSLITSWSCPRAASLAIDNSGLLWVLQTQDAATPAPQVVCYNSSGTLQTSLGTLTFASGVIATGMAYDSKNNRLLVTDNGPDCNIKIYNLPLASGSPTPVSTTIGAVGGVLSTANGHVAGQLSSIGSTTQYYNHPFGSFLSQFDNVWLCAPCIAVDSNGNITVIDGSATCMEQCNASGQLLWRNSALTFFSIGAVDPTDENNIYTWNAFDVMDYTQPPAGGDQWSYFANTLNPVTNTQNEPRVDPTSPGAGFSPIGMFAIGGQKFLVQTDPSAGDRLAFYRFTSSSEIGTLCDFFETCGPIGDSYWTPPNQPSTTTDWIWCDDNGNGNMDAAEYRVGNKSVIYGSQFASGSYATVDTNGDIWLADRGNGIVHFTENDGNGNPHALNSSGVPTYDYTHMVVLPLPSPFVTVSQAWYNPTTDSMYLLGNTSEYPFYCSIANGSCEFDGRVVALYNHWSTTQTLAWQSALQSMAVASASDGSLLYTIQVFPPITSAFGPNGYLGTVSVPSGVLTGWVDVGCGMGAYQRANGEHMLFQEDDGYGKTNLLRIGGDLPPAATITSPVTRQNYISTAAIPITVTATPSAGMSIAHVDFYADGVMQGSVIASPYSYTIPAQTLGVGTHSLTAMAYDDAGVSTTTQAVLVVITTAQVNDPNYGQIGYWNFNEDSGTIANDSSGQGYDFALNGAGWTTGKWGSAISLDSIYNYPTANWVIPPQAMTIAAWVQSNTTTWQAVNGQNGTPEPAPMVDSFYNFCLAGIPSNSPYSPAGSNGYGFGLFILNGNNGIVQSVTYTPTTFNANLWHHYVATFDGTNVNLYLDGALVQTGTVTTESAIPDNVWPLQLGTDSTSLFDSCLNGNLDSLHVFNRVLSATEVSELFNSDTLGTPPPTFYRVNAGGSEVTSFSPDSYYTNGNSYSTTANINTGTPYAAPAPVYASYRQGGGSTLNYSFPNLIANGNYTVRLHFCESAYVGSGLRNFSVAINGTTAINYLDVYATVGGNTALVETCPATADANGNIAIVFTAGSGFYPIVSAIEILSGQVAAPTFTPAASSYSSAQTVTISSTTSGAFIRYTTDGSTPSDTHGTVIASGGTVPISAYTNLQAIAYVDGMVDSITSGVYTFTSQCATPTFNAAPGAYTAAQTVTLATTTTGATISYTTDGSTPTSTHGTMIASGGTATLNSSEMLQAIAYKSGVSNSPLAAGLYKIDTGYTNFFTASYTGPYNGWTGACGYEFTPTQNLTVTALGRAVTGSMNYNHDICIWQVSTQTLLVKGTVTPTSPTDALGYKFTPIPPVALTNGTAYYITSAEDEGGDTWLGNTWGMGGTLSSYSGIAVINTGVYSPCGSFPTLYIGGGTNYGCDAPTFYTGGQYGTSATPTFSPEPGTYGVAQAVSISATTSGATIRYTTDGSTPSETNGNIYSGSPVIINAPTVTLQAIAYENGMIDSSVASGDYTIQCAEPTCSPAPGTYSTAQTVTISPASGELICYTTDGSTPTESNGTITHGTRYTAPLQLSNTCTLQAIAYTAGMADSQVIGGVYTINALPTDGLLLWLHADAITGISNGGSVTSWNDSSGNGYNAAALTTSGLVAPTYVTNVYNGEPVVRFGGNSILEVSALPLGPYTIAAVCKTAGNGQIVYEHSDDLLTNSNGNFLFTSTQSTVSVKRAGAQTGKDIVESNAATWAASPGVPLLTVDEFGGTDASEQLFLNGSQQWLNENYVGNLNTTTAYTEPFNIGGREVGPGLELNGDIAELVVYNHVLSSSDFTTLNSALMSK